MHRASRVVVAIFGILVVGCAVQARSGSPLPAAAASPSPAASASSGPASVDVGPFAIELPTGWQVRRGLTNPSGNWVLAYLSPADIPSDCEPPRTDGSQMCHFWPVTSSVPGGIIVRIHQYGMPGAKAPSRGKHSTVAGLEARRLDGKADAECRGIGGAELVRINVPHVPHEQGWFAFEACVARGAADALASAFDSMVHTATLAGEARAPS